MQSEQSSTTSKQVIEAPLSDSELRFMGEFLRVGLQTELVRECKMLDDIYREILSLITFASESRENDSSLSAERCKHIEEFVSSAFHWFSDLIKPEWKKDLESAVDKLRLRSTPYRIEDSLSYFRMLPERIAWEDCKLETEFTANPPEKLQLLWNEERAIKYLKAWGTTQRTKINKDRVHVLESGLKRLTVRCAFCKPNPYERVENPKRRRMGLGLPQSNCKWRACYTEKSLPLKPEVTQWVLTQCKGKHNHARLEDSHMSSAAEQFELCELFRGYIILMLKHNLSHDQILSVVNDNLGREGALEGQTLKNFHKKLQENGSVPPSSS